MEKPQPKWELATVLPGVLLILVACSQIYMTQFGELTPSKGGGFGMFSVTDMRASRAWSIDCLTEDGEPCRIFIPKGEGSLGEWLGDSFRTKPDAAARKRAADRIFRIGYVPAAYDVVARTAQFGPARAGLPSGWEDVVLLRQLSPEDAAAGVRPLKVRAIRFQAWRLRFDPASDRVSCEPIGEPEGRGAW
jgi:hypothetical protein